MEQKSSPNREMLRHALATVAYRGSKALRGAPASFAMFKTGDTGRTPSEILAHMGDLYDWALACARGEQQWRNSKPLTWPEEVKRFFAALKALDDYLASNSPLAFSPEKLFQSAVADSLTHIGQIAMLRRLAGCPIRAEDYSQAEITPGRVGEQQKPPAQEF